MESLSTEVTPNPMPASAVWSLLAEGARDMRATGFVGVVYGDVFVLMGSAITTLYGSIWQLTMGLTAA